MKEGVDKAGRWQVRGRQALLFCVAIALLSAVFSVAFLAGRWKGRDDGFFESERKRVFFDIAVFDQMYRMAEALENQSGALVGVKLLSYRPIMFDYYWYKNYETEFGGKSCYPSLYYFCGLMPEVEKVVQEQLINEPMDFVQWAK